MIKHQPKLADHRDPALGHLAVTFRRVPIGREVGPFAKPAHRHKQTVDLLVTELVDRARSFVQRDSAQRPAHCTIDVRTPQPERGAFVGQRLETEIDPHVVQNIVNTQINDREQPVVIDPQFAAQAEIIEISTRKIRWSVLQVRSGLLVDPADAIGEWRSEPGIKVGPSGDEQLAMAAPLLDEVPGNGAGGEERVILARRAMPVAKAGSVWHCARLHRRRRHMATPHGLFALLSASRPSARRYSATTIGSDTRV